MAARVLISAWDPDDLSGVAAMRVGLVGTFGESAWEPYATVKVVLLNGASPANVQVLAQFRDGAGNLSLVARAERMSGAFCQCC